MAIRHARCLRRWCSSVHETWSVTQARRPGPTLASFAETGETRLVYARYRHDPTRPLYFLRDGTAAAIRSMVKADLECPMPECDDRRLVAVSRHPRKRDGFPHYPGAGGHAGEGVNHLQAKELVARWAAAERLPGRPGRAAPAGSREAVGRPPRAPSSSVTGTAASDGTSPASGNRTSV